MFGDQSKQGFTLIELLVVMLLIGIMASLVVPNLRIMIPEQERKLFITQLNDLVQFAWQNALKTRKLHRIFFDFDKRTISVEQRIIDGQKIDKKEKYQVVTQAYLETSIIVPETINIINFFVENFGDEMRRLSEGKTDSAWFFVIPDGVVQEVTINLVDHYDILSDGMPRQVGLVMNPFSAQFKVYDEFKSP